MCCGRGRTGKGCRREPCRGSACGSTSRPARRLRTIWRRPGVRCRCRTRSTRTPECSMARVGSRTSSSRMWLRRKRLLRTPTRRSNASRRRWFRWAGTLVPGLRRGCHPWRKGRQRLLPEGRRAARRRPGAEARHGAGAVAVGRWRNALGRFELESLEPGFPPRWIGIPSGLPSHAKDKRVSDCYVTNPRLCWCGWQESNPRPLGS